MTPRERSIREEAIENQTDFALYSYCGTVGILCELDDATIDKKGYEHYGHAFVPADDMEEVCVDILNDEPFLTKMTIIPDI